MSASSASISARLRAANSRFKARATSSLRFLPFLDLQSDPWLLEAQTVK
jgi:hypothetical protein